MTQNNLPPLVGFSSFAEAGYPSVIWPVVFVPGCNFRCPYCLNTEVVLDQTNLIVPLEKIRKHVDDNQEDRILISGGEPTMHPNLGNLIRTFQAMDLKVGISTNGSYPERLKDLVDNFGLCYVAMDIKCGMDNLEKMNIAIPSQNQKDQRPGTEKRDLGLGPVFGLFFWYCMVRSVLRK